MYTIGVDLGGTNVAVGIVDENVRLLKKASLPTPAGDPDAIVERIASLCRRLTEELGLDPAHVASVGVATPGIVDRATGEVVYANNIDFHHFPLAARLSACLAGKPVYLENDANAAALGEAKAGAARGTASSVMITLGTGVGGGIIINGEVYMGANCAAGELGHIVIQKDGYPCSCGRRGCWEVYSSATGLVRMTKEQMGRYPESRLHTQAKRAGKVSGRTAFEASRAGDPAATEVVERYLSYLACGIANLINIFQPEVIVIGGGVSNEGERLLRPLLPKVRAEAYGGDVVTPPVLRIAELGNDAGIIGAACIGR